MVDFFKAGGYGMFPTLFFGFLLVSAAGLFALRPEHRYRGPLMPLGMTTFAMGLLGTCVGLMITFRYVREAPPASQFNIVTAGCEESLHDIALALVLIVVSAVIASIGAGRALRMQQDEPTT